MIKRLMRSITNLSSEPRLQRFALTVYYVAILVGVLFLSTHGSFTAAPFVYQGF